MSRRKQHAARGEGLHLCGRRGHEVGLRAPDRTVPVASSPDLRAPGQTSHHRPNPHAQPSSTPGTQAVPKQCAARSGGCADLGTATASCSCRICFSDGPAAAAAEGAAAAARGAMDAAGAGSLYAKLLVFGAAPLACTTALQLSVTTLRRNQSAPAAAAANGEGPLLPRTALPHAAFGLPGAAGPAAAAAAFFFLDGFSLFWM